MQVEREQRKASVSDRRKHPTSFWDVFRVNGRRRGHRRVEETQQPHFVDSFGPVALALVLLLLAFTIIDGLMTFELLEAGCQEINPFMGYLLSRGQGFFLLGKSLLTTAGLFFFLIFKNRYVCRGRLRVGYLLPIFVILYALLIAYELHLLDQLR
jgi:hypothetical protein